MIRWVVVCLVPFLCLAQQSAPEQPKIEPVQQSITVNATIAADAPASIESLNKLRIEQIPGINLDDRLHDVPGFSMYRRSSSLAANPTTQGISLRGIGSSGASRTLLLWDGIPVNSPFGGWIYWDRLDPEEMQRVEISRGPRPACSGTRPWAARSISLRARRSRGA